MNNAPRRAFTCARFCRDGSSVHASRTSIYTSCYASIQMSVIGVKLSDATASSRNQGRGGGLTINNGTDTRSEMGLTRPLDIPQDLVRVIDQHTWRMEREDWERRNPLIYYFKSCCHLQDDDW